MHLVSRLCFAPVGCALLFLAACASGEMSPDLAGTGSTDGGTMRCMPGSTADCVCLGGSMGKKTCRTSGQSYGECTGCMGEPDFKPPTVGDAGGNTCGDCDGCCDGTTCVPFADQIDTRCGEAGQACASCGAKTCDTSNGSCVTAGAGCGACSNGCCGMLNGTDHCYVNTPSSCGTGAGTCSVCTRGQSCDGSCNDMLDQTLQYRVIVTALDVYNTLTASGAGSTTCWDYYNFIPGTCGGPDLKVCFGYTEGTAFVEGCTSVKEDVVVPEPDDTPSSIASTTWNDTDGLIKNDAGQVFYIPGELFATGKVRISIRDNDSPSDDDIIAQGYIPAQPMFSTAYTVGAFGRSKQVTFKFR